MDGWGWRWRLFSRILWPRFTLGVGCMNYLVPAAWLIVLVVFLWGFPWWRDSILHGPPICVNFLSPYPSLLFIVNCTHSWVCQALGISLQTHRRHFYWHACFFLVLGSEPWNFGYQQIVNQTWYKIKPILKRKK